MTETAHGLSNTPAYARGGDTGPPKKAKKPILRAQNVPGEQRASPSFTTPGPRVTRPTQSE